MSPRSTLQFNPSAPRLWRGRYARIPGETTVLHVRLNNHGWWPVVDWRDGDDTAECKMVTSPGARQLVEGVLAGKRKLGVGPGGAFAVNEFGQVLVPASDANRTRVVVVGECSGAFRFENAFCPGDVFDLADDRGLKPGDVWDRPYVGIPHNLSGSGQIYFKQFVEDGTETLRYPPVQDSALISAVRIVRPSGPVRFIVTVGGLVATKVEVEPDWWEPRYVGQINPSCWFKKER